MKHLAQSKKIEIQNSICDVLFRILGIMNPRFTLHLVGFDGPVDWENIRDEASERNRGKRI